jgi:hypothetical protein
MRSTQILILSSNLSAQESSPFDLEIYTLTTLKLSHVQELC